MKQIQRIEQMEAAMDRLITALHSHQTITPDLQKDYQDLSNYYETEWLSDYEADERGELPVDLKRGVLSQDTLYEILSAYEELTNKTAG